MSSGRECCGERSRTTSGRSLVGAFPTVSSAAEWAYDASGVCCVRTRKLDPLVVATCVAASQTPSSGVCEELVVRLKPATMSEIVVRLQPDTTYADVANATREIAKNRPAKSRDRMSAVSLATA